MKNPALLVLPILFLLGCASNSPPRSTELPCFPGDYYAAPAGANYVAVEVSVAAGDSHLLAGTLTLPIGVESPPAVVLISGSSPQIRDMVGSIAEPVSHYRPFRQIANTLSSRGIAVLRLDDRGTGCSGGGPVAEFDTAERARDTRAALTYLRGRRDIDSNQLGLLGISEGANIAVMIAADDHDLRGVIAMAASATPGWQVWKYQTRYLISLGEEMDAAKKSRWLAGEDPERILDERVAEARAHVFAGEANDWWTFFFDFDPSELAPGVISPVLILHGDRDSNVPVSHARMLAEAIESGGNDDVSVQIFTNHNHLFLPDPDGGFRKYRQLLENTNQLPARVLGVIAEWLGTRLESK